MKVNIVLKDAVDLEISRKKNQREGFLLRIPMMQKDDKEDHVLEVENLAAFLAERKL